MYKAKKYDFGLYEPDHILKYLRARKLWNIRFVNES
jgi:hypothetical protein